MSASSGPRVYSMALQPRSGSQLMDTDPAQSSPGMCGPGAGAVCFPSAGKFKGKGLEVGGSQKGISFLLNLLLKEPCWILLFLPRNGQVFLDLTQ